MARTVVVHLDADTDLPDREDDPTGYLTVLVETLLARTYEAHEATTRIGHKVDAITKEIHNMATDEATFAADLKTYLEAVDTVIAAQQSASAKASAAGVDLTAEDDAVKAAQAKIAALNLTPPSAPPGAPSGIDAPAGGSTATSVPTAPNAAPVTPPAAGTPVVTAGEVPAGTPALPVTAAPVPASSLPPETPVVPDPVTAGASSTTTAGAVAAETSVVPVETAPVASESVPVATPVVVATPVPGGTGAA
ncbi:MAG: hypothetical protein M3Y91_15745 [Actinomycetota bacterium]|nr:hypothetical protein [Actinomycetota bacterium]